MPDQPRPHLWIPLDRTRSEAVITRGGGDVFVREDVAAHSRALRAAFNESLQHFEAKRDLDVATDLIVEITTASGRSAAKEREHLRNLGFDLIALSADAPNVAIARIAKERLPKFGRQLERYAESERNVGKSNFGAIEAIRPVGTERKLEPTLAATAGPDAVSCLITLFSGLSPDMKETVARRIASQLEDAGKLEVEVHRYSNGTVGVAADLTRDEMDRISEQYMFIRSIESNTEMVLETAVQADPVPTLLQVDAVKCETPVAVVDSGVNGTCALMAGLVRRTIVELPPDAVGPHLAHGTFVASRVAYGDEITAVLRRRATPWCPIIDVQVTGVDRLGNRIGPKGAALADILQRVVPALCHDTKVFNLSLGLGPITDGFYSTVARLLDFLAREHEVLFVVSAGNINDPSAAPPAHFFHGKSRILAPGESLLALTVGSIARYCEPDCVSAEREISAFSRRGPGADSALKPELAAHGGNVFFDGAGWTTSPRIGAYGLGRGGTHLEYGIGTSYAAPLVAQYAARLFDAYPGATPNLVKALLCHFAEPVVVPDPCSPLRSYDFCGFGEPNIERSLFATRCSATYVFQGAVRKDHYLYIPFHVPDALVDAARSRLHVRGTVVFDPPVSQDDFVNYSLCRVSGLLRKRGSDGLRGVAIGGSEDDALYPWNPILHFEHEFRRGYAGGEWELRLRLMTRGDLPVDFEQSLSVVIEVADLRGGVDVHDAIEREVPGTYTPVALRIAA